MASLSGISDLVKATEFIGQSSGKSLKGQSQKVQQAVLQKFRDGGYNVIVATSIGEEGLDIMEVDLVICFDANISPLRMIQRMGRTGRKHDGRVVVLAYEGSELKGYLSKQASCKTISKHMRNGGIKSFNFHPSPRMVPHGCKPEVLFVELSIEQFIPREKKLKDVKTYQSPILRKLSTEENGLLSRYFNSSKESTWKPSLIAFPSFQAFPSGVHKVKHSFKTTAMFIDSMQRLQGLSFLSFNNKDETLSQPLADVVGLHENSKKENALEDKISVADVVEICESKVERNKHDNSSLKPSGHQFLFGGEFLAVTNLGYVSILSVPALPFKGSMASEAISIQCCEASKDGPSAPHSPKDDVRREVEKNCLGVLSPDANQNDIDTRDILTDSTDAEKFFPTSFVDLSNEDSGENELSPRLTHFIEKGIVPESPVVTSKVDNVDYKDLTPGFESTGVLQKKSLGDAEPHSIPLLDSPLKNDADAKFHISTSVTNFVDKSLGYNKDKITVIETNRKPVGSLLLPEMESPLAKSVKTDRKLVGSPSDTAMKTPLFMKLPKKS